MINCLGESDLKELAKETLSGFDQRVASIPAELCAPFHMEARQLEAELLGIYRTVVLLVRKEDDLARVAALWKAMVEACDESLGRLRKLAQAHPECGADFYHDRVLDLRSKCHRLHQMHS